MTHQNLVDILMKRGEELLSQPFKPVPFTSIRDADALLNDLDHYPHAFVLACVMDRQVKSEKAWLIPYEFKVQLGSFEFAELQKLPPETVRLIMAGPPPLHRFPNDMATYFYSAIHRIGNQYGGKASAIWGGCPSSATIVRCFLEFEGVGLKIATMAANILVRELKIPVSDKFSIDVSGDVQVRRVFIRLGLIDERASNEELIYRARELNPMYPGIFDVSAWEIGRTWCKPKEPLCEECYMNVHCPTEAGPRETETTARG